MITEWQCTAQVKGRTTKGKIVWTRCKETAPEMNLIGDRFFCPYHAFKELEKNPDAAAHLVRMPPYLQRKIREAEARKAA